MTPELQKLLSEYNITKYELKPHYGFSLTYGKLKMLIVYNRFIHIPEPFNKIGYGVVCRREE